MTRGKMKDDHSKEQSFQWGEERGVVGVKHKWIEVGREGKDREFNGVVLEKLSKKSMMIIDLLGDGWHRTQLQYKLNV